MTVNHDTDLYDLTIQTKHGKAVIHATANHPIWDATTRTWVMAAELHRGDQLLTDDGSLATYIGGTTPTTTVGWMWDLAVSSDHDFYVVVGGTAVLVHNCGTGDDLPQYGPFYRLASPIQSQAVTQKIIDSGELWGGPGRFSDRPMVQAHAGPLPKGAQSVEFYTDVAPNTGDVPWRAKWSST